jgi:hypothetical protein
MDLEETEARDDCAGKGQWQFNQQTDQQLEAYIITTVSRLALVPT